MNSSKSISVELRVLDLERSNKRLKLIITLFVLVLAVRLSLGSSSTAPDTIATRELQVLDRAGNPRILLKVQDDGNASLLFRDRQGLDRATFCLQPDNNIGINFKNSYGHDRLSLALLPDGNSSLTFCNTTNKAALVLGVDNRGRVTQQGIERQIIVTAPPPTPPSQVVQGAAPPSATPHPSDDSSSTSSSEREQMEYQRQQRSADEMKAYERRIQVQRAQDEYNRILQDLKSARSDLSLDEDGSNKEWAEMARKKVDDLQQQLDKAQANIDKAMTDPMP